MLGCLSEMHERIKRMRETEDVPMEALNVLIEELAETMLLEDTDAWKRQYMGSTVEHL